MEELQRIKRLMDEMDVIISNYAELTTDTSDQKKLKNFAFRSNRCYLNKHKKACMIIYLHLIPNQKRVQFFSCTFFF